MTRDPESHRIYDMKDIDEPSPNGLCSVKSMHNIVDPSSKREMITSPIRIDISLTKQRRKDE